MAFVNPVAELVDNIQASVEGLVNDLLGKGNEAGIPKIPTGGFDPITVNNINGLRPNWNNLPSPYTFSVTDINGNDDFGFTDFELPLPPTAITQTEEFAISIRPTQGGTTTTHSGNRYKTLNIKGTTGIAPFRGSGGVNKKDGSGIFQPKKLKYFSGYEVFIRLRNWFKAYYQFKKEEGVNGRNARLIFRNFKDGEFLIVELLNFTMERQAGRPFLYDYDLEFKVLGHLKFAAPESESKFFDSFFDALDKVDQARGVFLRTQDILRQIEATYESVVVEPLRKTSLALKALLGVGSVTADMGKRAISNTVSAAAALGIVLNIASQQSANRTSGDLDPRLASVNLPSDLESAAQSQGASLINGLGEGLMALDVSLFPDATLNALDQERQAAQRLTRTFYEETIAELKRVKQNAEDFFNLGDATYDAIFERTATLSAPTTKVITAAELEVLNAFNDSIAGLNLLLSTEDLFKSTFDERIQDMVDRFDGEIALFALPAVKQVRYVSGQTLERLAQIHLRDSTRWGEIAEVNGLMPPYVTDDVSDTRDNIVKPGDALLIPVPLTRGFSQVPQAKEIKTTRGLNQLEKSLGTDLKLTSDFDLSLSNSGDFEVVSGTNNMAQAVLLKLGYERGEVIRHPSLGSGIVPGSKFPPLNQVQDGIYRTLLQDNRIENVEDLSLRQENSALFVTFTIKIKQIDIQIPIKIQV